MPPLLEANLSIWSPIFQSPPQFLPSSFPPLTQERSGPIRPCPNIFGVIKVSLAHVWVKVSKVAAAWRLSGHCSACGRGCVTAFPSLAFLFPSLIHLSVSAPTTFLTLALPILFLFCGWEWACSSVGAWLLAKANSGQGRRCYPTFHRQDRLLNKYHWPVLKQVKELCTLSVTQTRNQHTLQKRSAFSFKVNVHADRTQTCSTSLQ